MSVETLTVNQSLSDYFQGMIVPDTRKGYEGYMVNQQDLVKFSRLLRDDLGYDYLSSVTGVDYLPEGKIEVVYHAYRSTGGSALVFKVQVPREDPMVPSLVSVYPGVEFQEREAWDLLGIRFADHPDLRRILMWEGFAGHPLRKDWREPFYEEESKPFKNRWPEGQIWRAEDKNPYNNNINYPVGLTPILGRQKVMLPCMQGWGVWFIRMARLKRTRWSSTWDPSTLRHTAFSEWSLNLKGRRSSI